MNIVMSSIVIFIILTGVFSIATSSIAIDCYNKNEEYKKENGSNFGFLTLNLITAILLVLIGFVLLYGMMFRGWFPEAKVAAPAPAAAPAAGQSGGKWGKKGK